MSGKLSPLEGEALYAARSSMMRFLSAQRAAKSAPIPEVTWSGGTKPLSVAVTQTPGSSTPFDVSKIETILAADYVRNTLDMTDKPDTQE